jgi:hypothetical protein
MAYEISERTLNERDGSSGRMRCAKGDEEEGPRFASSLTMLAPRKAAPQLGRDKIRLPRRYAARGLGAGTR